MIKGGVQSKDVGFVNSSAKCRNFRTDVKKEGADGSTSGVPEAESHLRLASRQLNMWLPWGGVGIEGREGGFSHVERERARAMIQKAA